MKLFKKYRPSYMVMAGSLLLLSLLITLWIGKLYSDEKEAIKKNSLQTLDEIVDDEMRMFYDQHLKPIWEREAVRDSVIVYIPDLKTYFPQDSVIKLKKTHKFNHIIDSLKLISRKEGKRLETRRDFFDSLGNDVVHFGYSYRSLDHIPGVNHSYLDSLVQNKVFTKYDSLITAYYDPDIDINKFKISDLKVPDYTSGQKGLIVSKMIIYPSLDFYTIAMTDYKMVIFKRLTPQILFSLVVFVSTGLSFIFMIININRMRQFNIMKNDFVSNMTHELKTPISTVAVALEALTNFNVLKSPDKAKEYIDISKKELNRLLILVDKVLKMTMFDEKEPELNMEPMDLLPLTSEIAESMKLLFDKANGECRVHFNGSNFPVIGDKVHLTNVIYNLIENALKYSPKSPQVDVELQEKKNEILISVTDRGIGIESQFQTKVFDKFFRIPNGDRHNVKGHGLGLAYVTRVLEKHDGLIAVTSKLGEGSTFQITLPRAS